MSLAAPVASSSNASTVCNTPACVESAKNVLSFIDFNTHPCDDFYQYTCKFLHRYACITSHSLHENIGGSWLKNNPVPDDKGRKETINKHKNHALNRASQSLVSSSTDRTKTTDSSFKFWRVHTSPCSRARATRLQILEKMSVR